MKEIKVQEASATIATAKFEVGTTYVLHDICYEVISRTEKTVTFAHETAYSRLMGLGQETTTRKKIKYDANGNEVAYVETFDFLNSNMELHAYELKYNCVCLFGVTGYNFVSYNWSNEEDTAEVETAEVENVTADENIAEVENNIEENAVEETAEVENVTTNEDNTPIALIIKEQNYRSYLRKISETKEEITELEARHKNYTKAIAEKNAKIATYPDFNLTWEQRKNRIECDELQDKQKRTVQRIEVLKKHLKSQNEIIMQKAFVEINAAAAEIVDDGSNDDDYDEDEIAVTYNVNNDEDDEDELIDPPIETVETENGANEEDSATVKTAKEELIYVNNQIKGVQRNIAYYVEQIKEYLGCIAKCENFISNYGVDFYELQNKAAALENEIANRKLIDAIDYIGGGADAVDASVAAMEELNSANFTAANLLDAVNAADKAVEVIPVTFELQNFATADVGIVESYATIDTSISGTVIPVIDETAAIDSKVNRLRQEYAALEKQIHELEEKKLALECEFAELGGIDKLACRRILRDAELGEKIMQNGGIELHPQKGEWRSEYLWIENAACWEEMKLDVQSSVDGGYRFVTNDAADEYVKEEIAAYSTVKQFNAAIRGLVAAIERGDTKFTFPADIPPVTELPCEIDSDAEVAKQIWF